MTAASPWDDISPIGPSFDTIVLEKLKVAAQRRVPASVIQTMELSHWVDAMTQDLTYSLRAYVLAERLAPEHLNVTKFFHVNVPATWFQHLKQTAYRRWRQLGWARDRWPVRITQIDKTATVAVEVERYRTFPESTYTFPKDLGRPVNILVPKPTSWTWEK